MLEYDQDLFQRLSLDESLRRTVAVYCKGFLTFTKIAVIILGIKATAWAVLIPIFKFFFGVDNDNVENMEHSAAFYVMLSIHFIFSFLIESVGEGTMIKAVADIYLDREPDYIACLHVGARKACALMSVTFLAGLCLCTGFIVLFFPGLYLSVALFLITPVVVIEGLKSHCGTLHRSMNLVAGSWCYTFCTFLIVNFFMVIVDVIWTEVFFGARNVDNNNPTSHHRDPYLSVWGGFVASVPSVVCTPLFAIMKTVMYMNLRVEKEALNAEILARDLNGASGGACEMFYRPVPVTDDVVAEPIGEEEKAAILASRFNVSFRKTSRRKNTAGKSPTRS